MKTTCENKTVGLDAAHETALESIIHQNPEWVSADGSCDQCVRYEQELAEHSSGQITHEVLLSLEAMTTVS